MLGAAALALAAALVLAALGRRVATAVGQPAVVGEVVAGITFGALSGALPDLRAVIFPASSADLLTLVGTIGVSAYLIEIGREIRGRGLPVSRGRVLLVAAPTAAVSILGGMAAAPAFAHYKPATTPGTAFALFIGVAICVTALPVLARMLQERRLMGEPLAVIALGCALFTDLLAGVLLTVSVAWADQGSLTRVALAVAVIAALLVGGRALRAVMGAIDRMPRAGGLPVAIGLAAAIVVGAVHASVPFIVAAFLIGAQIGQGRSARELGSLGASVARVGLPIYFVHTGVRTSIADESLLTLLALAASLTLLAYAAKAAGTLYGAWRARLGWSAGTALAVLLNTRGVTELLVLNAGLDAHLLTPALFSAFVVMAVATTVITGAALRRLHLGPDLARNQSSP